MIDQAMSFQSNSDSIPFKSNQIKIKASQVESIATATIPKINDMTHFCKKLNARIHDGGGFSISPPSATNADPTSTRECSRFA